MEQVMKHYGAAILTVIVLLALGGIIMLALSSNGYVAKQFEEAVKQFFTKMNELKVPTSTQAL